jgi:glycosyltransferase involved in cell wall biosynthesis
VGPDKTCITFGFIGSLVPIKGIEPLLEAFARFVGATDRRARLLVAGDGKDDFAQGLRRRFAGEQIVFLGRVDPTRFYPLLDVLVVPSLSNDTFPFVVYEALGQGVPVIGSRRGGIPEVVQDGVTGLLFDPEDPGSLAGALQALCDEPRRREMASRGPASVAHLLDEDRFISAHETLYLDLIGAGHTQQQPGAPDLARSTVEELKG